VMKSADWIIDLGPEGGDAGGRVVAAGTPEQVARNSQSLTGKFLAPVLNGRSGAVHVNPIHPNTSHAKHASALSGSSTSGNLSDTDNSSAK
jgi:excinuclease ABC subunit A